MKKIIFFIFLACAVLSSNAQKTLLAPPNNNHPIPGFKIITAPDSLSFTNEQLKKNKPSVFMFFSPDCEHCQKETKELLAYKQELKQIQIIMVSPTSFGLIKEFYQDYNIASMPNITMGYDAGHALSMQYQLRTFPCVFVYDSAGKMIKEFAGNVSVPAILDAVNSIK